LSELLFSVYLVEDSPDLFNNRRSGFSDLVLYQIGMAVLNFKYYFAVASVSMVNTYPCFKSFIFTRKLIYNFAVSMCENAMGKFSAGNFQGLAVVCFIEGKLDPSDFIRSGLKIDKSGLTSIFSNKYSFGPDRLSP
jgi:hypothetical protein